MTAAVLEDVDELEVAAQAAVVEHLRSAGYDDGGHSGFTLTAFRALTRAAFDEHRELAYYRAEDACRGAVLNQAGWRAGINPRDLFHGRWTVARKWASEELLEWWEHGERRLTFDEYVTELMRSAYDEVRAYSTDDDEDTPMTVTDLPTRTIPTDDPTVFAEVPRELLERRPAQPEGAQALDEARAFYRRHFYFPSTVQADLYTLYVAGLTHMRDQYHRYVGPTATRLYIRASTPGAGKSLLGTFAELTGGRGEVVFAPATTEYGLQQMLGEGNKTVVLDNWDEVKGGRRDGQRNVLLAGMYPSTALMRTGRRDEPETYVYGPVILTAIGDRLRRSEAFKPVEERCAVVDVAKKPKDDKSTVRFDARDPEHRARAEAVRRSCEAWGRDVAPDFATYRPRDLPVDDMDDRQIDVWEPLVAVADLAGGEWPARARRALRALAIGEAVEADPDDDPFARLTPAQRTMAEVAHVLREHQGASIPTVALLEAMADLPGGGRWAVPEGTERQRLLKARTMALAADLAMFGVTRSSVKVPAGDGSDRYVNGWWSSDVLPLVPSDLPTFRSTDLERHAKACDEDDVPFD